MKTIEVRGLVKTFGTVRALDGIDLAAESGECLVLLGPSGCGKTTLLRAVAGLERPSAGRVVIGGYIVDGLPPRVRQVAMVFPSYALYPHKTVLGNIVFPLRAERMPRHMRDRKAKWAAEMLGLGSMLGRRPGQLTGAERQRVALARAVVRDPVAMLLDEPLSRLDPQARATARDELRRFQQHVGATTLYVTHDQLEAMALADRIAVLSDGRLRQTGTPRDVYDEPADTFVAKLMGTPPMNLVPRGDRLIGFRPEHLLPAENATIGPRATMPLTVERVEYVSGDRHVHGAVRRIGMETRVIARLPATVSTPLPVGATHEFAVAADQLRFFDAKRGTRTSPVRVNS